MKKFFSLVVALACVITVAGCGKADFVCTGKIDGAEGRVEGKVSGDQVTELYITSTNEANSEKEAEQAASLVNGLGSLASGQGIEMKAKVSGKEVTTEMTVDVTKVTKSSSAKSQVGFDLSNTTKDEVIKTLEKEGLTCK